MIQQEIVILLDVVLMDLVQIMMEQIMEVKQEEQNGHLAKVRQI